MTPAQRAAEKISQLNELQNKTHGEVKQARAALIEAEYSEEAAKVAELRAAAKELLNLCCIEDEYGRLVLKEAEKERMRAALSAFDEENTE